MTIGFLVMRVACVKTGLFKGHKNKGLGGAGVRDMADTRVICLKTALTMRTGRTNTHTQ